MRTAFMGMIAALALIWAPAVVAVQSQAQGQSLPPVEQAITLGFADDISYGEEDAPITLIEYASLTCNHCGTFANEIFPRIYAKYILTGRVRMLFRNFVLNRTDMAIALITRCQDEDQARAMVEKFFETQATWLQSKQLGLVVNSIASEFGLSEQDVRTCIANRPLQQALVTKMQEGSAKYDITGTPTIVVNGTKLANYAWETVDAAIQAELEKQGVSLEVSR